MQSFLDKMQTKRTVLKRTKSRAELPALVLYLETVAGQPKRRVLDTEGKEHEIEETVLQSTYKLVTGAQAKELHAQHWPKVTPPKAPAAAAK
jgi:hypothetical protein